MKLWNAPNMLFRLDLLKIDLARTQHVTEEGFCCFDCFYDDKVHYNAAYMKCVVFRDMDVSIDCVCIVY